MSILICTPLYKEIIKHFAFEHGIGRVLESLWQLVYFNTTVLSKEFYHHSYKDDPTAESRKFTEKDILGETETTSVKFATILNQG